MEKLELSFIKSGDTSDSLCLEHSGCHPLQKLVGGSVKRLLQTDDVRLLTEKHLLDILSLQVICGKSGYLQDGVVPMPEWTVQLISYKSDTQQACEEQGQKKMLCAIFKE